MTSPSFVDGLWKQLRDAFEPYAERRLARFVRQRGVTKWIIATDFCIDDSARPNDSFAFVILPAGDRFAQTHDFLSRIPQRDLKQVKRIPQSISRLFRDGRVFSVCFVGDRERRLFPDASWARRSVDDTIAMMKDWNNAAECGHIIQQFEAARNELNKKSINLRLLANIVLASSFAAFLAALLSKHGSAELVGWAADRDKITDAYNKIAETMFSVNVSAVCQQFGIKEPKLGVFHQTNDDLWCDRYVRLPDYLAGAAAASWDRHGVEPPAKIVQFIGETFPDNQYLLIFVISFGIVEGQFRSLVSRVKFSRRPFGPHQQGKGRSRRAGPIDGIIGKSTNPSARDVDD